MSGLIHSTIVTTCSNTILDIGFKLNLMLKISSNYDCL